MKTNNKKSEAIEEVLGKAFRDQPVRSPSETWYDEVMANVRTESGRAVIHFPAPERVVWRISWAAAAAALVVACVGVSTSRSESELAWQLQRAGAYAEWILDTN
jgi:hypothetical protein